MRLLRVGSAGGGRATGVLSVWAAWERLYLQRHPLRRARPDGLFSFRIVPHHGPRVCLAEGTVIDPGDDLLELHLDNRALGAKRELGGFGAWTMMQVLRSDLAALAAQVEAGEIGPVAAFHGVSLMGRAGAALGFEVHPLPHTLALALTRYFMVGIDAIHHPAGLKRLEGRARERWPVAVWMTVAEAAARPGRARRTPP
ncbi:MAG TPA: hypothetical protein VMU49_01865 [Candidatus Acidoferrales bacterium]|nr:hypothetical protein [Candidatus Acidoferrales bacterium]